MEASGGGPEVPTVAELLEATDNFVLDCDGVLYTPEGAVPGAAEALALRCALSVSASSSLPMPPDRAPSEFEAQRYRCRRGRDLLRRLSGCLLSQWLIR